MSRRLHLFKHPWSLHVSLRSADSAEDVQLFVGDSLNVKSGGKTYLRIRYEGKTLQITQVFPVLAWTPEEMHRWADFAEKERTA